MSSIEKNIAQFSQRYNFEKRNYNIIIYSPDATGKYDFIIELMATNPFKNKNDVESCLNKLKKTRADSVIGVTKVEEHHPARLKKIESDKITDFCVPELSTRRQDLRPYAYIRNGSIYALNRDKLIDGMGKSRIVKKIKELI